jgi:serine/threonine-protein kinase
MATVMLTGGPSASENTATVASTTAAQIPAGPTTTVETEPSAESTPTPTGPPAVPPPPVPTGPTLATDALAPLLLPAEEVGKQLNITGASAMAVETQPLGGNVAPPHCTGAWGPGYGTTYNGTGFTGMAIQGVTQGQEYRIAQAVLAFPDPAAAQRVYDRLVTDWNACQNTHAVFSYQGASTEIDIKTPRPIGDINTLMLVPTTSPVPGQQCERGMALRGNVIVDVRACSPTVGSAGYSITRAIADRIH